MPARTTTQTTAPAEIDTIGALSPALGLVPGVYVTRQGARLPFWSRRRRATPKPR
ncbi:hypothetical protein AB0F91_06910 [Amycolatopsis sp. NPDC023774]|uniref:hypothetical protein n=1 Tax=Amycolatopsis sp. NPDC023774 TaxID=3155015 RepID=UPI0033D2A6B5